MASENFQCARNILVPVIGPWLGPEKSFQIRGSQKVKNAVLRLVFANTVLHEVAILLMFCKQNSYKARWTFLRIQNLL